MWWLGCALCLLSGLLSFGLPAQSQVPSVIVSDLRFTRQLNRYDNFVDTGLASSSGTKSVPPRLPNNVRVSYSYIVSAAFKNTGDKAIKALEWDYVLTDKKDEQHEILRLHARNEKKIAPGQERTLESREKTGLDHIWTTRKNAEAGIVITRVEYADDTVWVAGKLVNAEAPR